MSVLSAWRAFPGLVFVAVAVAVAGSADRADQDFFRIDIRTRRTKPYLYGERVFVEIWVRNDTGKPLTYFAADDKTGADTLITAITMTLTRDGKPVRLATGGRRVIRPVFPRKTGERKLRSRGALRQTLCLEPDHPFLPPGTYKVQATLEQRDLSSGRTTAKAHSGTIVFTVKGWKPKAHLEKVWYERVGPDVRTHIVRLVQTTDGDTLIYWRDEKHGFLQDIQVVPIHAKVKLESVRWTATDDYCHIVCDQPEPGKRLLITAYRDTSWVEVLDLEPAGPVHHGGAGRWVWRALVVVAGAAVYLWFRSRRRRIVAPTVPLQPKENGGNSSAHAGDT